MTTIYMGKRAFREAQRSPYGAERAHAMCRKVLGTASQETRWYGAHYWAACVMGSVDQELNAYRTLCKNLGVQESTAKKVEIRASVYERYLQAWTFEVMKNHYATLPPVYMTLWEIALKRMFKLWPDAKAIKTSVLW